MSRHAEEFSALAGAEQQLLNAAVCLRAAEHRLEAGPLQEQIRTILQSLEGTTNLARRAKHRTLRAWRLEAERSAVERPSA